MGIVRRMVLVESQSSYILRQLKSPLSNINRLDNHLVMSTGADVILCVILAMTRVAWCWHYANLSGRKTPPVGNDKYDFKKGAKGSIGYCYCCGWLWFD